LHNARPFSCNIQDFLKSLWYHSGTNKSIFFKSDNIGTMALFLLYCWSLVADGCQCNLQERRKESGADNGSFIKSNRFNLAVVDKKQI